MTADLDALEERWHIFVGPMPSEERAKALDTPEQKAWRDIATLIGLGNQMADALRATPSEPSDEAVARELRAQPEEVWPLGELSEERLTRIVRAVRAATVRAKEER